MSEPREKTAEEIRDEFLGYLRTLVAYWLNAERAPTAKEKLEGLVFSTLVALDGGAGGLTGSFYLLPSCHESDPEYLKDNGENWWPTNAEALELARGVPPGALHEEWSRRDP